MCSKAGCTCGCTDMEIRVLKCAKNGLRNLVPLLLAKGGIEAVESCNEKGWVRMTPEGLANARRLAAAGRRGGKAALYAESKLIAEGK